MTPHVPTPGRRICIVTPGYISSTPRVVREADALSAAGYDVRVVFTQGHLENVRGFDEALMRTSPWRAAAFRWSGFRREERWAFYRSGVRQRLAQALEIGGLRLPFVERAEGRVYPELRTLAAAEPADLFIGHYPIGLAAAAYAAKRHGARLGYDVEDLYAETYPPGPAWARERTRILAIERRYVPRCDHVSVVSAPVGKAFAERYKAVPPIVVHNCHPWSDRQAMDGQVADRRGPSLSLYWFSQTIGLDRGLQDAIRAVGAVNARIQVHLRGAIADDVQQTLRELATGCGVSSNLHIHPPSPPDTMLSRAAEHDVGLALETEDSLNRRLTVTNKLFLYLTAGLAVATTDVPGQRGILESCPQAGALHAPGDVRTLSMQLAAWVRYPDRLAAAKQAALTAAHSRWNAEREGEGLVAAVNQVLGQRAALAMASGH